MKKALLALSLFLAAFTVMGAEGNERLCDLQYKQCKLTYKARSSILEFGYRSAAKDACQATRHACRATVFAAEGNLKSALKACKETKKSCNHIVDARADMLEFGYRSRAKRVCRVAEQTCIIAVETAAIAQASQLNQEVDVEEVAQDIADELAGE